LNDERQGVAECEEGGSVFIKLEILAEGLAEFVEGDGDFLDGDFAVVVGLELVVRIVWFWFLKMGWGKLCLSVEGSQRGAETPGFGFAGPAGWVGGFSRGRFSGLCRWHRL
jgi:hypothetical protein